MNELENRFQDTPNAEYHLVRLDGKYTWKCNLKSQGTLQKETPLK